MPPPQHPGVHRFWSLMRDDEECVGAVIEGRVPGVIDEPPPEPFVATLSYAQMGTATLRRYPDGREFIVRPILGDSPKHQTQGWRCQTIEAAIEWLDSQKARLLAEGWAEMPLDAVEDPD